MYHIERELIEPVIKVLQENDGILRTGEVINIVKDTITLRSNDLEVLESGNIRIDRIIRNLKSNKTLFNLELVTDNDYGYYELSEYGLTVGTKDFTGIKVRYDQLKGVNVLTPTECMDEYLNDLNIRFIDHPKTRIVIYMLLPIPDQHKNDMARLEAVRKVVDTFLDSNTNKILSDTDKV